MNPHSAFRIPHLLVAGLCLLLAAASGRAQGLASSSSSSGSSSGLGSLSSGGSGGSSGGSASGTSSLTGQTLSSGGGVGSTAGIGSGNLSALGNGYGLSSLSNSSSGGGKGGSSSSNGYPTVSNPYVPFYADPYMAGVAGSTANNIFGQPVFPITATTTTLTPGQSPATRGFSTIGIRKTASYVTTVGDDLPLIQHPAAQLELDLRRVIERSTTLSPKNSIRVTVQAGVVRLEGQVVSQRDRRLAESLLELSPGVQRVVNDLVVTP